MKVPVSESRHISSYAVNAHAALCDLQPITNGSSPGTSLIVRISKTPFPISKTPSSGSGFEGSTTTSPMEYSITSVSREMRVRKVRDVTPDLMVGSMIGMADKMRPGDVFDGRNGCESNFRNTCACSLDNIAASPCFNKPVRVNRAISCETTSSVSLAKSSERKALAT